MKTYTVDVHPYPHTYTIVAESEADAKEQAKERFSDDCTGMSVYETVITDVEDIS